MTCDGTCFFVLLGGQFIYLFPPDLTVEGAYTIRHANKP